MSDGANAEPGERKELDTNAELEKRMSGELALLKGTKVLGSVVASLKDHKIIYCRNIDNPVAAITAANDAWTAASKLASESPQLLRIDSKANEAYVVYSDGTYLLLAQTITETPKTHQ